jgi:hypothetical protein
MNENLNSTLLSPKIMKILGLEENKKLKDSHNEA